MGGESGSYLKQGDWQFGVAYRRLTADEWFVGRVVREDKAPFGKPLYLNMNSLDFTLDYGLTNRIRLSLVVPFTHGTHSRFYADGNRHQVSAGGLGDINITANYWLKDPTKQPKGNVELGVGMKTPSGSNTKTDDFFVPGGKMEWFVDQSIQLGDGGWGVIVQGRAFREFFHNGYGYASGSYLISPKNQTHVTFAPAGVFSTIHLSVPDVYTARMGLSYTAWPSKGLQANLGTRLDGIPLGDLFGSSDGFRRPAVIGYVEPGLSIARGRNVYSFSIPIRVYADFRQSNLDKEINFSGGGDLAKILIFASYQRSF